MGLTVKEYTTIDINYTDDERWVAMMSEFSHIGNSLFWLIIPDLCKATNHRLDIRNLKSLSWRYRVEADFLKTFIEFCISIELFRVEDEFYIFSKSNRKRIEIKNEKSKKYSNNVSKRKDRQIEDPQQSIVPEPVVQIVDYDQFVDFTINKANYTNIELEFTLNEALPNFYNHWQNKGWTDKSGNIIKDKLALFKKLNRDFLDKNLVVLKNKSPAFFDNSNFVRD